MGKGTFDEIGSTRVTLQWFSIMVLSAQVVGIIAIIILAVLLGQYRGGFGWAVRNLIFEILFLFDLLVFLGCR